MASTHDFSVEGAALRGAEDLSPNGQEPPLGGPPGGVVQRPAVDLPWVDLFKVRLAAADMDETVEACRAMAAGDRPRQHVVLNAAKVVKMADDPGLAAVVGACDLISADGSSIVLASRLARRPVPCRVAGIDLFLRLVEAAAQDGSPIFLLGAAPDVVAEVEEELCDRFSGLEVAGARDGFWNDDDPEEISELLEQVRESGAKYLFLAIPSPRKEFWLSRHLQALGVPFVMGVGGSFDVVAGRTSRAPVFLQKIGQEWVWRLVQEPRRMWRRYLVGNSRFLILMIKEMFRSPQTADSVDVRS